MTNIESLRVSVRNALAGDTLTRMIYAEALDDNNQSLLAAHQRIIAEPDNDTWRYALADVLESYQPLRAELVRVQCELARFGPRPPACKKAGKKIGRNCPGCLPEILWQENTILLRDRESTLLTNLRDTLPKCQVCDGSVYNPDYFVHTLHKTCPLCSGTGYIGTYTRGIVEEVRVPRLADVWGLWSPSDPSSDLLRDEWKPTQWARDLIRDHHSVLRVWCEDWVPTREEGGWEWYDLPDFLCIPATKQTFDNSDAAQLALSVAVADSLRNVL